MFEKIMNLIFKKSTNKTISESKISGGTISASKVSAMTVSADVVSINTECGHFEIANNIGVTKQIQVDKYLITIMGGIITDVKEIK